MKRMIIPGSLFFVMVAVYIYPQEAAGSTFGTIHVSISGALFDLDYEDYSDYDTFISPTYLAAFLGISMNLLDNLKVNAAAGVTLNYFIFRGGLSYEIGGNTRNRFVTVEPGLGYHYTVYDDIFHSHGIEAAVTLNLYFWGNTRLFARVYEVLYFYKMRPEANDPAVYNGDGFGVETGFTFYTGLLSG
jgi:hypothetical protein